MGRRAQTSFDWHVPVAAEWQRLPGNQLFASFQTDRADPIAVMAVMHLHRDPDYWKNREFEQNKD